MRSSLFRPLLTTVLFFGDAAILLGQDRQAGPSNRQTVGIALEGGGAKGLAHVGVLQWLEEHHIPVDYIAGTSMGGLIGGLYATGLRPSEIREIVTNIDWNEALAGQTPYEALSFRRKEDLRTYPNRLELGLRGGLSVPSGLSSGQAVRILIDRYLLPYSRPQSFDNLPIPFRCVATELVSGKVMVFSEGSIANALRATMSLPGVFYPVRDGDKIYADGGMLNNLPTDVVKQMGADFVVGLHLSVGPVDPKQLRSLFGVAGGATGVMIDANVLRGMELSDLLVTIDVAGYTTLDFSRADQIIGKGYAAALAKEKLFERFKLSDDEWKRHISARESRRVATPPVIEFVTVEGIEKDLASQVSRRVADHTGKKIDTTKLEEDLNTLIGIGRFDSLNYGLTERDGQAGLLITAEEKDHSPPWLKPGFLINGADPDNVGFTFATRITVLDLGGYRSEVRTDLAIGSRYEARTEYYHPFHPLSKWFVAPRVGADRAALNLYKESDIIAEYRLSRAYGGVDIGYGFDRFSELRIGYEAGYASAGRRIGLPLFPTLSGRTGTARVRYAMDRLDDPVIPRRGVALVSAGSWVDAAPGNTSGFPSAEATILAFRPVSKPASVYAMASGGSTFGRDPAGLPPFALGGPDRLAAYGLNQFITNQYAYGRAGYLHQIGALPPFLGGGVFLNAHYEVATLSGSYNNPRVPHDAALGIATETIFGPLMFGGSFGGSGHRKWFFQFGKLF
ncbi:MAG TPA: patatin-like phospholipase family protein [Bryobacteraceae bacterium]|nr:patatin-like phospholipase family protein [Bryobacteraceae bacterium]